MDRERVKEVAEKVGLDEKTVEGISKVVEAIVEERFVALEERLRRPGMFGPKLPRRSEA